MQVRKLRIQNFKSIRSLELECRRINVFIGEANTGKSNILEAIGLLSCAHYGDVRRFVRLQSMIDIFYNSDVSRPIQIKLDSKLLEIRFEEGKFIGKYVDGGSSHNIFEYSHSCKGVSSAVGELSAFKLYRFRMMDGFPDERPDFLLT